MQLRISTWQHAPSNSGRPVSPAGNEPANHRNRRPRPIGRPPPQFPKTENTHRLVGYSSIGSPSRAELCLPPFTPYSFTSLAIDSKRVIAPHQHHDVAQLPACHRPGNLRTWMAQPSAACSRYVSSRAATRIICAVRILLHKPASSITTLLGNYTERPANTLLAPVLAKRCFGTL